MDIVFLHHLVAAANELNMARQYVGTDELTLPLWDKLLKLQDEVEEVIKGDVSD